MKTTIAWLCLLLGCAHPAPTQPVPAPTATPATSGAVFVGCGYLYVGNAGHKPFSALLRADDARQVPGNDNLLALDGVVLEVQLTTAAEIGVPTARGLELLRAHQKWEADYTSKTNAWPELHATVTPLDYGVPGLTGSMWGYDVPGKMEVLGQRVDRIAYVTGAIDDAVFVLSIPLRPGDDVKRPAQKAGQIMRSVKLLERPIDVQALSAEVKRTPPPWRDCR